MYAHIDPLMTKDPAAWIEKYDIGFYCIECISEARIEKKIGLMSDLLGDIKVPFQYGGLCSSCGTIFGSNTHLQVHFQMDRLLGKGVNINPELLWS